MDSTFGRRLPALVERFGIRELGHDGVTLIGRGGDPTARCGRMTGELLRGRFVTEGVLAEADFDERGRAYDRSNAAVLWGHRRAALGPIGGSAQSHPV
jgi:hypothetical protein